ncbi:MAG: hypothetical protein P4N41_02845 [Negativicutes bacterium]|nr:hypothetical protein [Negativicutes bacterium]
MNNLEQKLADLFVGKMPGMSAGAKETAVKVVPWIMIVFGVLGFLAWLSALRFFFFGYAAFMGRAYGHAFPDIFTLVYFLLAPIVQVMVVYGGYQMLSKKQSGWRIALYALLIGLIPHLAHISILGLLLDVLFAYILFQIKDYFTA